MAKPKARKNDELTVEDLLVQLKEAAEKHDSLQKQIENPAFTGLPRKINSELLECISLIDPKGTGFAPGGSPDYVKPVLSKLKSLVNK